MLDKKLTHSITVEPPSHEDIEASIVNPDGTSLELEVETGTYKLMIQAKSRSTGQWTAGAITKVLLGEQNEPATKGVAARIRPLQLLEEDPQKHYIFVTNEGVHPSLRVHTAKNLLDISAAERLPLNTGEGRSDSEQARIARQLLLYPNMTLEVLNSRIKKLLEQYGHVPPANHTDCLSALESAVRLRMTGAENGEWASEDLWKVVKTYGGSIAPNRSLDHYVEPRSYAEILHSMKNLHAVVISGPSGTGKTLTADKIEMELRQAEVPFYVVGPEHGPSEVRGHFNHDGPILFHLRDPWGENRPKPNAECWNDELPKLLSGAGAGRKFLITTRSDILAQVSSTLMEQLAPYLVTIKQDDYQAADLARIYDNMCLDMSERQLESARRYRYQALAFLTLPYEVDRFISQLKMDPPQSVEETAAMLKRSQIAAISNVIAAQVQGLSEDAVTSATILWALLEVRKSVSESVVKRLNRKLRNQVQFKSLNLNRLINALVSGENLHRDGDIISFHHPKVEDGLRKVIRSNELEAEEALQALLEVLVNQGSGGEEWDVETAVLIIKKAKVELNSLHLEVSPSTQSFIDVYLEEKVLNAEYHHLYDSAKRNLIASGSAHRTLHRLIAMLMDCKTRKNFVLEHHWRVCEMTTDQLQDLKGESGVQACVRQFVMLDLPYSSIRYGQEAIVLLGQLGVCVKDYRVAFEKLVDTHMPSQNLELIVDTIIGNQADGFEFVIDLLAEAHQDLEHMWRVSVAPDKRAQEDGLTDASPEDHLDHITEDRSCFIEQGLKAAIARQSTNMGFDWIEAHRHRDLIVETLADCVYSKPKGFQDADLGKLLSFAQGQARHKLWRAATRRWTSDLTRFLEEDLLRTDIDEQYNRAYLIEAAVIANADSHAPIALLIDVAKKASTPRRLELILDILNTHTIGLENIELQDRKFRALALAASYPPEETELGNALIHLSTESEEACSPLGESAKTLLSTLLPATPLSIAAPLVQLAAMAGLESDATIDRILASKEQPEQTYSIAVKLLANATPCASEKLFAVLRSHEYASVRRQALKALVAEASTDHARIRLLCAAVDPSAYVRLEWVKQMVRVRWIEAIDSLVSLLDDERDFQCDYGHSASRSDFKIARNAALALSEYESLPPAAVDKLIELGDLETCADPELIEAAIDALKFQDTAKVQQLFLSRLRAWKNDEIDERLAEAASYSILSRASKFGLLSDPVVTDAACFAPPEIAVPLLFAMVTYGSTETENVLKRLSGEKLMTRHELLMVIRASTSKDVGDFDNEIYRLVAQAASGASLLPQEKEILNQWESALDKTERNQFFTKRLIDGLDPYK